MHVEGANDDDEANDCDVDASHDEVETRGFLHAADENNGADGNDDDRQGRQAEGAHVPVVQPVRQWSTEVVHEGRHIGSPAARHCTGADAVLEQQVPGDEPRNALTQAGVGKGVGRAADGHARRELGVAKGGEHAGQAGEHEGKHDARARILIGRNSHRHVNPRTQRAAQPVCDQVPCRQRAMERCLAHAIQRRIVIRHNLLHRLGATHSRPKSSQSTRLWRHQRGTLLHGCVVWRTKAPPAHLTKQRVTE
mmetsp:Transcript_17157/g.55117  ORF Transcript_17157/g.55117 Transcript_17157/m.55117 type:complete len:251 (-) Transcript_17157:1240-1992(-)